MDSNYLSKFGYVIHKSNLTSEQILEIKNELKARPLGEFQTDTYNVYIETKTKLYIPKIYGLEKFGQVKHSKSYIGEFFNNDIEFKGELFPEQKEPANNLITKCKEKGGGILQLGTGFGKCLGKDTKVLMCNGDVKYVSELKINDVLLGDDLKPRKILSLIHGYDNMYNIYNTDTHQKIASANKCHIICVVLKNNVCINKINSKWNLTGYNIKDKKLYEHFDLNLFQLVKLYLKYYNTTKHIIEISIGNYLKLPQYVKNNIYGCKINTSINSNIHFKNAYKFGKNFDLTLNSLPKKLLMSNEKSKINFIKGLKINKNQKTFIKTSLLNDILYICDSICIKYKIINNNYVKIIDNFILQRDYLLYKFKIIYDKIDCFYGFEISDNKRFLLSDMSITHNTVTVLYVLSKLKGKTIVVVNKIPLLNQWKQEINTFLPDAKVGVLQGSKNINVENCDIIIAMLQSLSSIDYPKELFNDIKISVYDEIHNIPSKKFSKVLFKLTSLYTIGLSATPERGDGCEYVFKWHVGDIISKIKMDRKGLDPLIYVMKLKGDYKEFTQVSKLTGKIQLQFTTMLSDLISMNNRNLLIVKILKQVFKSSSSRKILVLSDRRSHLQTLFDLLTNDSVDFTFGIFVGGMKENEMSKSRSCNVILATFSVFKEGVSEKDLNTLILTTPKKFIGHLQNTNKNENGSLEQIVGRIFRKEHTQEPPLIIDLFDNFSVYKSHFNGRKVFYKQHFKNSHIDIFDVDLNKLDSYDDLFKSNNKIEKTKKTIVENTINTFLIDESL